MRIGVREKIFASALMALSIFFILYDQIYLKPDFKLSIERVKTSVRHDVNFIQKLKTIETSGKYSDIVKLYLRFQNVKLDTFPAFLFSDKNMTEKKGSVSEIKTIIFNAFKDGEAQGEYQGAKDLMPYYGIAVSNNKAVILVSRSLEGVYAAYESKKTRLITISLVSLIVAFLFSHILAKKIM